MTPEDRVRNALDSLSEALKECKQLQHDTPTHDMLINIDCMEQCRDRLKPLLLSEVSTVTAA